MPTELTLDDKSTSKGNRPYCFRFLIDPVAKGRPRFARGIVITDKKTRDYERALRILAIQQWTKKPLTGPLRVSIQFYIKKPKKSGYTYPRRPDLDNLIKNLDAFNGLIWEDDCQITEIESGKWFGPKGEILMYVTELE